jgi:16S rRNA C1402 N4-methylase RsmH
MNSDPRRNLVEQVHHYLETVLRPGDIAVDATVGNGHDTLFLARLVGEQGRVYGFDIQQQALDAATRRLQEQQVLQQVELHQTGHEHLTERLPADTRGRIKAVMFNLGYLPSGDKAITTRPNTTLKALECILEWLAPDGVVSVLAYTGHPGGREEAERVKSWAAELDREKWQAKIEVPPSRNGNAPEWVLIRPIPR